jgi:hypothetical protein
LSADTPRPLSAVRGDPFFARLAALIQRAFPSSKADAATIALMLEGLKATEEDFARAIHEILGGDYLPVDDKHPLMDLLRDLFGKHTLYEMHATHLRMQPIYSCFTGVVKAARVTLHETGRLPIFTAYGGVYNVDHLLFTVGDVRAFVEAQQPGFPAFERVDLITPARKDFLRFAPVAIFLGYEKQHSPTPSFFILEAGLATGEPMVLYFAQTMDHVIEQHTGYVPTPFTKVDNWYRSTLSMSHGGAEPDVLAIEGSTALTERPYIAITCQYAVLDQAGSTIFPGSQTMEAGVRLATIATALDCTLDPIEAWAAKWGVDHYEWNIVPAAEPTS